MAVSGSELTCWHHAMTWKLNARSHAVRRKLLGDALLELRNALSGLSINLDETLPPVRNQLSVPLAKIVLSTRNDRRLLNCVSDPALPPLRASTDLRGDAFELFEPIFLGISPPTQGGPGTGLEIDNRGVAFPLHGLGYDRGTDRWSLHDPWNTAGDTLAVTKWLSQPLVQVNTNHTQTIGEALRQVRDKRGAHADNVWIREVPQPLRTFYELYIGLFMVALARLLTGKAAAAAKVDDAFAQALFPKHRNPNDALRTTESPHETNASIDRIGLGKSGWSLDYAGGFPWSIERQPRQGAGSIAKRTSIWFIRAPGPLTHVEQSAVKQMLLHPTGPSLRTKDRRKP